MLSAPKNDIIDLLKILTTVKDNPAETVSALAEFSSFGHACMNGLEETAAVLGLNVLYNKMLY